MAEVEMVCPACGETGDVSGWQVEWGHWMQVEQFKGRSFCGRFVRDAGGLETMKFTCQVCGCEQLDWR